MDVKSPKTYDEQLEILRSRGCFISDDSFAADFLKRVNYYRFSGYMTAFKQPDDTYIEGTTFEKVSSIYDFDQNLRIILIKALSEVEITAKSILAYHHAHAYGPLGYLDKGNFNEKHDRERFANRFEASIQNNKSTLIVKHHRKNYDGKFPICVATELFTMGMISLFYADLSTDDKRVVANEYGTSYKYLESWLHSSAVLRNICAHYGRLYNVRFHQNPKLPREFTKHADRSEHTLFNQLYMLKLLYSNYSDEWNNAVLSPLVALVEKYEEHLDLNTMGLPVNWSDVLRW
jgi:abortive infection bacteriophage resistance protein